MAFQLYNTLTHRVEPFIPADPARITFYTCGPTVYDDAHIGNFRSFLAADVLRRWLESPLCTLATPGEHRGPREVVQVMNITDVGHMTEDSAADGGGQDKMELAGRRIAEAKKAGKLPEGADIDPGDPGAIADFFTRRFIEDATDLGLEVAADSTRDPSLLPRASDNIRGIQDFIAALIDRSHAYVVGQPGSRAVYFDVRSFDSYGRLSGNTLESLRGGAGGRVSDTHQQQKRNPGDFLLWKEDATHLMKWPSPWGEGYPGWHIECSVMSLGRLVPGGLQRVFKNPGPELEIDLHSGGEDNIFPHHECERAQSCSILGSERFARHWFHARFLMVNGEKMSKSRGTFFTARQLFEQGHEPAAVRLELIKAHYRSNADFSMQGLKDSARMVERWRKARLEIARRSSGWTADARHQFVDLLENGIAQAMADDLNIAGMIGHINRMIEAGLSQSFDESKALPDDENIVATVVKEAKEERTPFHPIDIFDKADAILGVLSRPRPVAESRGRAIFLPGTTPRNDVEILLEARADARVNKDFAKADEIRDRLRDMGYTIKDVAGGKVEVGPA